MIYRVTLNYYDFDFKDAEQAMIFAQTAKNAYLPEKPEQTIKVEIELIEEEKDA